MCSCHGRTARQQVPTPSKHPLVNPAGDTPPRRRLCVSRCDARHNLEGQGLCVRENNGRTATSVTQQHFAPALPRQRNRDRGSKCFKAPRRCTCQVQRPCPPVWHRCLLEQMPVGMSWQRPDGQTLHILLARMPEEVDVYWHVAYAAWWPDSRQAVGKSSRQQPNGLTFGSLLECRASGPMA